MTPNDYILGIDVSHHNGTIDWQAVAKAGIAFAYAKATEGARFTDPEFRSNRAGIRSAGLLGGAYHFFHPEVPVSEQVKRYLSACGELGPGDLPPMLDLEETSRIPEKDEWPRMARPRRAALALEWLQRVEQAVARKPIVYLRCGFVRDVLGDARSLAQYPIWIAHYTPAPEPLMPEVWERWTFWQFTDAGRLPGIASKLDVNRFQGSLAELRTLAALSPEAPIPPLESPAPPVEDAG